MKGTLIIAKSHSFYDISNNLIKVDIRGNNNKVTNHHRILELIIKGNNNTIEVIRKGKIENIKIFGNNNKIDIQNNSETNVSDQGTGNNIIRNTIPQDNGNPLIRNYPPSPIIHIPRPIQFPIFNFNNINQPIFNIMPNTQNRENEILSKFKESPFFNL